MTQATEAEEALADVVRRQAEAAATSVSEGMMLEAIEHLHVASTLARIAAHTEAGTWTEAHTEAASRAAWAEAGLLTGDDTRLVDDLDGIEEVAAHINES